MLTNNNNNNNPSTVANPNPSVSTTPDVAAKPSDNTGRNVRDRSDAAVTPGDQSESKADLETTRQIRRAITQNDQMSTMAKNVKIVTANGKVTLRGPVKSDAEKQQIADLAKGTEGVTSVDNELEVKGNQ
jgi:osmotically-inducible protein OsmY